MDELTLAKQQYFKLMRLVTKGHELSFLVNNDKLFALVGINQRLLLCESTQGEWSAANITEFWELENFMNTQKTIDNMLTEKIRLALFGYSS